MKSGIGTFTVTLPSGVMVSALAAVNAVGDVIDPATAKIIAGARNANGEFANSAEIMKKGSGQGLVRNTTLVVIATNAALTKVDANRLAHVAQAGMVRTINPVNTMSDGDVVIALSVGAEKAPPIDALGVAASEAVAESILRAVRLAPTLGGVPGLKK
jgi:L-aminopeptidase/D-esterase-like protein